MKASLGLIALAILIALPACGGVTEGSTTRIIPTSSPASSSGSGTCGIGDSGAGVPFSEWVCALAEVQGTGGARCGSTASYLQDQFQTQDAQNYLQYAAEIDAGRVVYDPIAAQECLTDLSSSCDELFGGALQFAHGALSSNASCRAVFTGTVPTNGSCFTNEECASQLCTAVGGSVSSGGDACPGTCAPPQAALGKACDNVNTFCAAAGGPRESSLYCSFASDGAGTCEAYPSTCPVGFFLGGYSPTCQAQVPEGGACGQDQWEPAAVLGWGDAHGFGGQCADGLACVGYAGGGGGWTAGRCQPPSDVGGACVDVPPGVNATEAGTGCLSGLLCVNGACKIPPSSGPCGNDPIYACDPRSSYCSTSTQTCVPWVPLGGACDSNEDGCLAPNWCDTTNHCTAPLSCQFPSGLSGSNPMPTPPTCQPLTPCPTGATHGGPCDPGVDTATCGTSTCECVLACNESSSGDAGAVWVTECP